jgi:hypothetical protein
MKNRWNIGIVFGSVCMFIMIMIVIHQVSAGKERAMDGITATGTIGVPPIDRTLPDKVETATFALG